MPWDIVNDPADAGAQRSKVDSSDLDALVAGFARTGVLTGGAVTVSTATAVAVAAGTGELAGVAFSWSAATPTVAAADAANPRRDLVTVTSAGVVAVTAGTAAANPVEPAIPASSVLLAVVEVLAGATDRTQYLSDRRVMLDAGGAARTVRTPEQDGAAGNGMVLHDAAVTSGATTLTSASAVFTGRAGQAVWVAGAGAAGAQLVTTISSVTTATTAVLAAAAGTTVTAAQALVGTDDTAALNTWLARAASSVELRVTPGAVYAHAAVATMTTKTGALLVGRGARFVAPVQATSALNFIGVTGLEIRGLEVTMHPEPTSRGSTGNHYGLYFQDVTDFEFYDLHVSHSHAAGILLAGCVDGRLYNPTTVRSRADALHITGGSARVRVYHPKAVGHEDDGVAVVSYTKATPATLCRDVKVYGARVWYPKTAGRGLAVVGGHDVWFHDFEVHGTQQAGLYFACEGAFDTHRVTDSGAVGGRLVNCVRKTGFDQPAIFVYAGQATVNNDRVTVLDVEVVDSGSQPTSYAAVGVGNDAGTGGSNLRVTMGSSDQPVVVSGTWWPPSTKYDAGQAPAVSNLVLQARTPPAWFIGSAAYAGETLAANAVTTATVTTGMTGVTVDGSVVTGVMLSGTNAGANGMRYWGHPSAAGTVRVYAQNTSGASIVLGAGQWNVTASDI